MSCNRPYEKQYFERIISLAQNTAKKSEGGIVSPYPSPIVKQLKLEFGFEGDAVKGDVVSIANDLKPILHGVIELESLILTPEVKGFVA